MNSSDLFPITKASERAIISSKLSTISWLHADFDHEIQVFSNNGENITNAYIAKIKNRLKYLLGVCCRPVLRQIVKVIIYQKSPFRRGGQK